MSDLLTSLVDRALDRAPVLQRREPTLFEPVPGAAFDERSQFGKASSLQENEALLENDRALAQRPSRVNRNASQVTDLSSIIEEPPPRPAETRPTRRRDAHDSKQEIEDDRDRIQRDRSPASHAKESSANPVLHDVRPARDPLQPAVKPQEIKVAPQRVIETVIEKRVEVEIAAEHSGEKPSRKAEPTLDQLSRPPRATREDDRAREMQPLKAAVKPVAMPGERPIIKPAAQKEPEHRPGMTPYVRAVSRIESSRSRNQSVPPSIQVTIGRIEVRATPQSADKSKTARPAGPKLSLEEYLRSRSGGN